MGFRVEDYDALRPYMYHTCPRGNAQRILNLRRIEPTSVLLELAGRVDLLRTRRGEDLELVIDGTPVLIRDQMPLNPANIDFEAGWELADLVEYVNRRIFFWPGGPRGPIDYGSNHFNRYADEQPVVLRMRLRSLIAANPAVSRTSASPRSAGSSACRCRTAATGGKRRCLAGQVSRRLDGARRADGLPLSTG